MSMTLFLVNSALSGKERRVPQDISVPLPKTKRKNTGIPIKSILFKARIIINKLQFVLAHMGLET